MTQTTTPVPPDAPPAESSRTDPEQLAATARAFAADPLAFAILDAADVLLMVIDDRRQIVAANAALAELLAVHEPDALCGSRPGEALRCVHAADGPDGCGTGRHCAVCEGLRAIRACQSTRSTAIRDCRMTIRRDGLEEAREFRVKASPLPVDGETLTVVSLRDVSAQKRREVLEHVFLHDLANTLGGLFGWSSLLRDTTAGEERDIADRIYRLGQRLKNEVEDHRTILLAEEGALRPSPQETSADAIVAGVERDYREHPAAAGRRIEARFADGRLLRTDPTLAARVVGNMIKNALEATPKGGRVVIRSEGDGAEARIAVWNEAVMPPDVQLKVFERAFSTKAAHGRGLGTFGMKLLGERYLGGRVTFRSAEGEGTTFTLALPRSGPGPRGVDPASSG